VTVSDSPRATRKAYILFGFTPAELFWSIEFGLPALISTAIVVALELALRTGFVSGGPHGPVPSFSTSLFNASYVVSGAMLGVVLAGAAVMVSFIDPHILARMYDDDKEMFDRYFANIFFPIELAVVTVITDVILRSVLVGTVSAMAVVLCLWPVLLLTLWQLTSLRSAIYQIRRAMVTKAKIVAARMRAESRSRDKAQLGAGLDSESGPRNP
jgi:hypothetical protein